MRQVYLKGMVQKIFEVRQTQSGTPFLTFNVEVVEKAYKGDGDVRTRIPVKIFGRRVEKFVLEVREGDRVFVSGKLDFRSYKTQDGTWKTDSGVNAMAIEKLQPLSEPEQGPQTSEDDIPF